MRSGCGRSTTRSTIDIDNIVVLTRRGLLKRRCTQSTCISWGHLAVSSRASLPRLQRPASRQGAQARKQNLSSNATARVAAALRNLKSTSPSRRCRSERSWQCGHRVVRWLPQSICRQGGEAQPLETNFELKHDTFGQGQRVEIVTLHTSVSDAVALFFALLRA